jgi:hypothetical protein
MSSTIGQTNAKYKIPQVSEEPLIGLAMPFQPTMQSKNEISQTTSAILSRIKCRLDETYGEDAVLGTMVKLENLINSLYHATGKKSVVISIDQGTERVIYLNHPVATKLLINEPFYLGELVENRQPFPPLLLLILSGSWAKLYHFENYLLRRISFDRAEYHQSSLFPVPASSELHQCAVAADENKLFRTVNCNLSLFYQNSFCPVIVAGNAAAIKAFIRATPYKHHIVDAVYTDKNGIGDAEVLELLKPVISKGRILRQKYLLNIIHHTHRRTDLLFRQKNVELAKKIGENSLMVIDKEQMRIKRKGSYTDNTTNDLGHLDTTIEQLLKNNGHVETIDGGMPRTYGGVVLLKREKHTSPIRLSRGSYGKRSLL